mmetsp:Transcript_35304/g.40779  ORF Transcript_35304/g.40779 Transcript_35304/m.40779 type:complete len:150 (-) Transcript_35304:1261-1710(-)
MSTILQNINDSSTGHSQRIHVKGAAEMVINKCTHYLDEHGDRVELTEQLKNTIVTDVIEKYAMNAMRTFGFAYQDLAENQGGPAHDNMSDDEQFYEVEKTGLTLIGAIGVSSVIRQESPYVVSQCKEAGIRVRMITGDNKISAKVVAKI